MTDATSRRTHIENRIEQRRQHAEAIAKRQAVVGTIALVALFLGTILGFNRYLEGESAKFLGVGHGTIAAAFLSCALALLAVAWWHADLARREDQRLADLEFERDLIAFDVTPFVSRAEKLLSINQVQLRRYHELNLQQGRAIFFIGFLCIIAGLGVVAATLLMVKNEDDVTAQAVIAAVGAVGTLLTNYVASVFFRIYGEVGRSIADFHRQLADTHDMFFANLLASGIDGEARAQTLIQLALAIAARHRKSETAGVNPNATT